MGKKLIVMVGLPRSGKSNISKKMNCPVVNRDAIRLAVHGKRFLQEAEDIVTLFESIMVKSLFKAGHDTVIIDACHITQKSRDRWTDFCLDHDIGVTRIYPFVVPTSATECIRRAEAEGDLGIIPVIRRMAEACDVPQIVEACSN
jgi:predicted kinase